MAEREAVRQIAERMLAELEGLEEAEAAWWALDDDDRDDTEEPLWAYLESCLDVARIETVRGDTRELRGWELLLCYGGPNAGLELDADGRATVWAAWWSPRESVEGRLPWLAQQLEELGL